MQSNMYFTQIEVLWKIFSEVPTAVAYIRGNKAYPEIKGIAHFYPAGQSVLVLTEVMNLPTKKGVCDGGVFALHIHEGTECTGNNNDSFANVKSHYNPDNCVHPHHAVICRHCLRMKAMH